MATPALYDLISIKLQLNDETRRIKLPLKDLTPSTLPQKLREALSIPANKDVVFERFSDSAGAYVVLDSSNMSVYKQLYRAAKAKSKLRIKVLVTDKVEKKEIPIQTTSEEKVIPILKSQPISALKNQISSANSSQTTFAIPVYTTPKVETPAPIKMETPEPVKVDTKPTIASPLRSWTGHLTSFTVQCNHCGDTIPDAHYHCDVCDNNDFDLCLQCVENGVHCDVDHHFLIKRTVVDGKISNSATYKFRRTSREQKPMPGSFQPEIKATPSPAPIQATRTCNSCVTSLVEDRFITCLDCEDFDLCDICFKGDKHGHHPAHSFKPVADKLAASFEITRRLLPGRGLRHFATCDGCDKNIFGVRHKCLTCPDFDFCDNCNLSARHIHPGHRFAPLYEHIGLSDGCKPLHQFIRCDGPLCKNRESYIRGDRYKCAVCPDTDFCANCEALPTNDHCRSHPLIKLRTPVRNVSVTTFGEDANGEITSTMGDKPPTKTSKSTETLTTKSANAATQVQTIAEIKPASPKVEPEIKQEPAPKTESVKEPQLAAHFVSDTLLDGTKVQPNELHTQTWTLRNPGPDSWPAGCTVRYTGGDNMLNIDTNRPASNTDIEGAVSSNTIPFEVMPEQDVQCSVTVRVPANPGRAVSYWRLKTPDGKPFGHKLWCDVEVVAKEEKTETVKEEPKEDKLSESQMVFPTLEKESPASSIIADTPKAPTANEEDVEFVDDFAEAASLGDDEFEDAFLTDEEYEMLDTDSAIEEAVNGKK